MRCSRSCSSTDGTLFSADDSSLAICVLGLKTGEGWIDRSKHLRSCHCNCRQAPSVIGPGCRTGRANGSAVTSRRCCAAEGVSQTRASPPDSATTTSRGCQTLIPQLYASWLWYAMFPKDCCSQLDQTSIWTICQRYLLPMHVATVHCLRDIGECLARRKQMTQMEGRTAAARWSMMQGGASPAFLQIAADYSC